MAQLSATITLSISLIGISRWGVSGVGNSMRIRSLMRLARVPGVVRQSVGIECGSMRPACFHLEDKRDACFYLEDKRDACFYPEDMRDGWLQI